MEPAAAVSEARREEALRAPCRVGALPPPEAAENMPCAAGAHTDEPTFLPGNREIRDSDNIRKLRSYLNLKARVTVSDNRVFVGNFVCIDKLKNLILVGSEEFTPAGGRRRTGSVMIPGRHLVKAEIENLDAFPLYT